MDALGFPDWKKIGWHLGKKLRDILDPPRDTGPSKEERRGQRLRDVMKGFAYFDNFDELIAWRPGDIDPVQQANTPLLERSATGVHDQSVLCTDVLLCHDYSGGYHDYESIRPPPLRDEQYSCHYLQHVDVFIYFSHKLICVPPPTWTNTMHRNGVKILGTFIIEPGTPEIERMLSLQDGGYKVATQLASMAHVFGFDGWLLNVEKEFPKHFPDLAQKINGFILDLRHHLGPKGKVIWYDALNINNEVEYQNGLTAKNFEFAKSAGALFTNYRWTKAALREAQVIAREYKLAVSDILFGIDVWAQNTNMPGPPRITFPEKGGGGTNTGLAMRTLAGDGFSTAIFGPAWTYEHFSTFPNGNTMPIAKAVHRSMWEGFALPEELNCDCHKDRAHHSTDYRSNPIVNSARQYPAGSSLFLETNFSPAFAFKTEQRNDVHQISSVLGSQDVLPNLLPVQVSEWEKLQQGNPTQVLYGELQHKHPTGLMLVTKMLGNSKGDINAEQADHADHQQPFLHSEPSLRLRLFKLNMPADGTLEALVRFSKPRVARSVRLGFYAAYKVSGKQEIAYKHSEILHSISLDTHRMSISYQGAGNRLVEFGVYCEKSVEMSRPLNLLQIERLVISPHHRLISRDFTIYNVHAIRRGEDPYAERRLAWQWRGEDEARPDGIPWSKTTGPFSYFKISIQRREVGKAYGIEFPVRAEDIESSRTTDESIEIQISGILFGGEKVISSPVMISVSDLA